MQTSKQPRADQFDQTAHSLVVGGNNSLNTTLKARSKSTASIKKFNHANEFLTKQLDPDKVDEYTSLLEEFERTCISERKFKDAELAAKRIKELREQEVEYRNYCLHGKADSEIQELESINVQQFNEFNRMWDDLIQDHVENIKQVEEELIESHQEELRRFDEEIEKIVIPKPKFSKELLDNRHILQKLVNAKQYSDAQQVSDKIEQMERKETDKWNSTYKERFIKKKQLLVQRQANEVEALRVKMQNSLQEKLRMRQSELQKLLQRFQNMKKSLEQKQSQEISKANLQSTKSKQSGYSFRVNQSFATQNLDVTQNRNDRSQVLPANTSSDHGNY